MLLIGYSIAVWLMFFVGMVWYLVVMLQIG